MSGQDNSLLAAAEGGKIDEVRQLLYDGANPNARGTSDLAPLHHAAKKGTLEVIELLLQSGADPDVKTDNGSTPLHNAAEIGHAQIIQLLIDHWADVNAQDNAGDTPLHVAAKGKSPYVVKLLLDYGADPELSDGGGSTPRFSARTLDIAKLLNGQEVSILHETQDKPTFPITINGNTLDSSTPPAVNSIGSNYILVQTRTTLSPNDRQALSNIGVEHLDYIANHTYLCRYENEDLGKVRQIEAVLYVDIYRTSFKVTPSLANANLEGPNEVDIVFHSGVDTNNQELRRLVSIKSNCPEDKIEFFEDGARLTIQGNHLDNIASIDDVQLIEEVGIAKTCNTIARQILGFNPQRPDELPGPLVNRGAGEVIAIADSGLDRGKGKPLHPAFGNRVIHWIGDNTADESGHGTHVSALAVGDFAVMRDGGTFQGAASDAKLIVCGIGRGADDSLYPPGNLMTLFQGPYHHKEKARVHSNSWSYPGTRRYTRGAKAVDTFVCRNPDMVICFAAGNEGRTRLRPGQGHIGAEAAAKNCITVGASEKHPDTDIIADYSSRGPTDNGHHKPDVVAPGSDIISALSSLKQNPPNADIWWRMSGTSMATPLVAGCAAILREALRKNISSPTAALIKALLINGADVLGPLESDSLPKNVNSAGFGRVNIANALAVVKGAAGSDFGEFELSNAPGATEWTTDIVVAESASTLKVTLVWSDPPGPVLKNPLSLVVRDINGPRIAKGDVVKQVIINNVPAGNVTLKVGPISEYLNHSPQKFALVWRTY
ncbi:hypothetical protein MY8738_008684 [Beauveria namnaoensis]